MTKMQKRMKRARSAAWSPAARRKRAATRAAKLAARGIEPPTKGFAKRWVRKATDPTRDAIVFLEYAEKAILASGGKRISAAESYAMLALTTLRGN